MTHKDKIAALKRQIAAQHFEIERAKADIAYRDRLIIELQQAYK